MNTFFLILFACLSVISFYARYVKKEKDHFHNGAAAVVFLPMLTIGIAIVVYIELTAKSEVAKYITPYNGNMTSQYAGLGNVWQFESTDAKEVVEAFYADEDNYKGWDVISDFPFFRIQKGNKIMRISVRVNFMKKTSISYTLSQAKEQNGY